MNQSQLRLSFLGPLGCTLLAACGNDLTAPAATPPASAVFAPSLGQVPLPSDLLFSGSTDLTLSIPGVDDGSNPSASPVEVALSGLDGWSTSAPFTITFNSPLDATTLVAGTTVRMFEVTLNMSQAPVGGPVTGVVAELAGGTDFSVGLAPEISTNTSMRVYLNKPLKAATSYMWVLTNGIEDLAGRSMEKTGEYLLASSPDLFPSNAPIFPLQVLVNSQLAAAVGEGIVRDDIVLSNVFTTQGITNQLDALAAVVGGNEAAVIAALCTNLPSQCVGEDLNPDPNNTSVLSIDTVSLITTADRLPGSSGHADLYTGGLSIPYYLTAATNPSDTAPVSDPAPLLQRIRARYPFHTGDTTRHWTSYNVLPISTRSETIPVLVSVPNVASGQTKPVGGWPTVIFQHGITRSRLDMIPLADSFADAGIMMVAIDLPLHGSIDSSDAVLFAGYDGSIPGARERTFGLDLLNAQNQPVPNGVADASGAHFLNLANLLVAEGNLAQGVSDLMHLTAQLPTLDYDGGGADVDPTRIHFVGHSLGGMVGLPFLRQSAPNIVSATLAMSGSGIAKLLDGSQSFGPILQGGLAAAGVLPGTADYEAFLWGAQTAVDRVDPINYATQVGLSGLPIHFMEVIGGGSGGGQSDATIPNSVALAPLSGSDPLIATLGLQSILADTVDLGGIQGVVRFIEGAHESLITPASGGATFSEMSAETIEFVTSSGTSITLVDESVVDTTP